MSKLMLIYCYDAYCGWCYGFSPVLKKIAEQYKDQIDIEVLSGGMLIGEEVMPIEKIGPYIQTAYKEVEQLTGIKFGEDFLWHINNYEKSDWVMNSEKPAIALCVFKDYFPDDSLLFAASLQYALNFEGRDLDDDESYRHLLVEYNLPEIEFYSKLKSKEFKTQAYYEFEVCRHLKVSGFPQVFIQETDTRFKILSTGFSDYDTINARIQKALKELSSVF